MHYHACMSHSLSLVFKNILAIISVKPYSLQLDKKVVSVQFSDYVLAYRKQSMNVLSTFLIFWILSRSKLGAVFVRHTYLHSLGVAVYVTFSRVFLGDSISKNESLRKRIVAGYEAMLNHEAKLTKRFLAGVSNIPGLKIYGNKVKLVSKELQHLWPSCNIMPEG